MEKEDLCGQTAALTKENFQKITFKDVENTAGQMEESLMAIG